MADINFKRSYELGENFESARKSAYRLLAEYLDDLDLLKFDSGSRTVTFTTERLIPERRTGRPRLMLLFSNPHPCSIQQGMFLSPDKNDRKSVFWPVMEEAGFFTLPEGGKDAQFLCETFVSADYEGPFDYIFYCYYPFPTNSPEDLAKIFGKRFFSEMIEPDSQAEFKEVLEEEKAGTVVAFNKTVYNLAARDRIDRYLERLIGGELIKSRVKWLEREVPIYLTFPTGWRHHRDYRSLRKQSLERISRDIIESAS